MTHDGIPDHYARVSRMLGYALTLGDDPQVWDGLAIVLKLRLTRSEQARLFEAVLRSTHPDDVGVTLNKAIEFLMAGSPLPVLAEIEAEARWWADLATLPELHAWLAACFVRLPHRDQLAFRETVMRRVAA